MTIIGIDPGGDGVLGGVVCSGWVKAPPGVWPPELPMNIRVFEPPHEHPKLISDWELGVWLAIHEFSHHDMRVGIEDCPATQLFNAATIQQVGALRFACIERTGREPLLASAQTVRAWLLGGRPPKGKGDALVDQVLLRAYGGREVAVGGQKCSCCKGKGRVGRGRKRAWITNEIWEHREGRLLEHGGRWYQMCQDCRGEGESLNGPLYPLWKPRSMPHHRAALAVALYTYAHRAEMEVKHG